MPCWLPSTVQGREQEAQGVLMQSVTVTAEMAQELIVKLR